MGRSFMLVLGWDVWLLSLTLHLGLPSDVSYSEVLQIIEPLVKIQGLYTIFLTLVRKYIQYAMVEVKGKYIFSVHFVIQ